MTPRIALTSALVVALSIVAGPPTLRWLSRKMLFPAPATPSTSRAESRPDVEVVHLPSGAEAWLLPPMGASRTDKPAPAIIFSHGNGELIDYWLDEFQVPRDWGVAVLLVEYPGYGRSPGTPSQRSISRTMVEAHDFLSSRSDIDPGSIVAYGRSLGGGAAAAMAKERRVAALILESTFTSVVEMAKGLGFPGFVVADRFDNLEVVKDFSGPILGLHGTEDSLVPYEHARRLQAAGKDYQLVTLPCGHNDCPRQWHEIRDFLVENGLVTREDH